MDEKQQKLIDNYFFNYSKEMCDKSSRENVLPILDREEYDEFKSHYSAVTPKYIQKYVLNNSAEFEDVLRYLIGQALKNNLRLLFCSTIKKFVFGLYSGSLLRIPVEEIKSLRNFFIIMERKSFSMNGDKIISYKKVTVNHGKLSAYMITKDYWEQDRGVFKDIARILLEQQKVST